MVSPDPSQDLDDVRRRYSDAASRLSEIAEAAAGLTKASGQLDSARGSLSEAATTFVEIAKQHQVLLEETRRVIESVSSLDPAALHTLLTDVKDQTAEIGNELGTSRQASADVAAKVEARDAELLELMRETSQRTKTGVKIAVGGMIVAVAALAGVAWIILGPLVAT